MKNTLFTDSISEYIIDLSEDFKNRSLYKKIRNNSSDLLKKVNDNDFFISFINKKTSNNQIKNVIKFYEDYQNKSLHLNSLYQFINELISVNLGKVVKLGYIDKKDYDRLIKKYDFNKTLELLREDFKEHEKSDIKYYGKLHWMRVQELEGIDDYYKIVNDFFYLKRKFFLDYTNNNDKIIVDIEYLIAFYKNNEGELVEKLDFMVLEDLENISALFIKTAILNTTIVKTITSLCNNILGIKLNKGDVFLLTFYNKLVTEKEVNKEQIINLYNNLLSSGYISKKIKNIFSIKDNNIFESKEFIFLWLNNIITLESDNGNINLIFLEGIFNNFLDSGIQKGLDIYDDRLFGKLISVNISDVILEDYKIDISKSFLETGNINKKNIPYTTKIVKEHKSIANQILGDENGKFDDNIYGFLLEFFELENNIDNYNILLEPLYLASKRLINSNIYTGYNYILLDSFYETWKYFKKKYKGKNIKIDEFITAFFEKDMNTYLFFQDIKDGIIGLIGRKIDVDEMGEYLLSEKQLFKRVFVYLARVGYLDMIGQTEYPEITYFSGDSYNYGYGGGLSKKYVEIEIFEPNYIKFKDVVIDIDFPKDNHISGNDIYLSLNTNTESIEQFAKFTKLEKIENYAVLNISRDTLIKAKNEHLLSEKDIIKEFSDLNLEIPKNLKILIQSTLNQKADLELLPIGIPIILDNLGIFKEFLKLKLFNKYILYSNEDLKLIIFDIKFKSLENTLNNRKILYKKNIN